MCVSQMKLETKVSRIAELKVQIEALQAKFDELKASISEELNASGSKSAEVGNVKVTLTKATYWNYKPDAIEYLKGKGLVNCVKESVNTSNVNACLKAGVLAESELNEYRTPDVREALTVKIK